MKNLFTFIYVFITTISLAFGQGIEGFNRLHDKSSEFYSGSFVGEIGINWDFTQCHSNLTISRNGFKKTGIVLKSDTTAEIISSVISGGIGLLKINYSTFPFAPVKFDVFVNSTKVSTLDIPYLENAISSSTGDIVVNLDKPFYIEIKQTDKTSGQVIIEKVSWSKYSSDDYSSFADDNNLTISNASIENSGLVVEHLNSTYHLFPNPAKEYVYIEMSEYHNILFKLFTLTGQMVHQEQIKGSGQKININNLKEGLYIYKILDEKGKLFTGKMIIR